MFCKPSKYIAFYCFVFYTTLYMYKSLLGRAVGLPPLSTEDVVFLMQTVHCICKNSKLLHCPKNNIFILQMLKVGNKCMLMSHGPGTIGYLHRTIHITKY